MINRLKLTNYESYKKAELKFSEKINCIVGSSDSGKSGLLRALYLLINNSPAGVSYINHDSKKTEVELHSENNIIKRIRSKSENLYFMDEEKFEAFGQNTPEEIKEAIAFDEINIQNQFVPHFLISEPPGEVARILNRIIKLDQIDVALKNIEHMKRTFKRDSETAETNITQYEKEIEELKWIENVFEDIKDLKDRNDLLETKKIEVEDLKNLVETYKEFENDIKLINRDLKNEDVVNDLLKRYDVLGDKQEKLAGLESIIIEIEDINKNITKNNEILKNEKIVLDLNNKLSVVKIKIDKVKSLEDLIGEIEDINNEINKNNKILKNEKIIKNLLNRISDNNARREKSKWLDDLYVETIRYEKIIEDENIILTDLKKKHSEFKSQYDMCPFCGKEME